MAVENIPYIDNENQLNNGKYRCAMITIIIGIGWLNWLQNKQNKYFFQKKKILLTIQNNHHFFSKSEWIKESKMNNNNKKNKQRIKQEFDFWIKELKELDEKRILWMQKKPLLLFCFFLSSLWFIWFCRSAKKPNQTRKIIISFDYIHTHKDIIWICIFFSFGLAPTSFRNNRNPNNNNNKNYHNNDHWWLWWSLSSLKIFPTHKHMSFEKRSWIIIIFLCFLNIKPKQKKWKWKNLHKNY